MNGLTDDEVDFVFNDYGLTDDEVDFAYDVHGYIDQKVASKIIMSRNKSQSGRLDYKQSKHADNIDKARALAKANSWPALTGTTKQKWWAEQIRAEIMQSLPVDIIARVAKDCTSASWWINNRSMDIAEYAANVQSNIIKEKAFKDAAAAKAAAEYDLKQEQLRLSAIEFMPTFMANNHLLQPFDGQPCGRKMAEIDIEKDNLRVFKNMANGQLQFIFKSYDGVRTSMVIEGA